MFGFEIFFKRWYTLDNSRILNWYSLCIAIISVTCLQYILFSIFFMICFLVHPQQQRHSLRQVSVGIRMMPCALHTTSSEPSNMATFPHISCLNKLQTFFSLWHQHVESVLLNLWLWTDHGTYNFGLKVCLFACQLPFDSHYM